MNRPINIFLKDVSRANSALLRHILLTQPKPYRLFSFGSEKEILDYLTLTAGTNPKLMPDAFVISPGMEDPKHSLLLKHLEKEKRLDRKAIALTREAQEERDYPEDYQVIASPLKEEEVESFLKVLSQLPPAAEERSEDAASSAEQAGEKKPRKKVRKNGDGYENGQEKDESNEEKLPGNMRVLLVDPNKATSELLNRSLDRYLGGKCLLESCRTLKEATRLLKRQNYDALVADLDLPDSGGIATLKSLKSTRPELATITVVARGEETVGEETLKLGARKYLVKDPDNYIPSLTRSLYSTLSGHPEDSTPELEPHFEIGEALDSAPFMMIAIDQDLNVRNCNDAFYSLSRLEEKTVLGSCLFAMLPELKVLPLARVFSDGRAYQDYSYKLSKIGQGHYLNRYWDLYAWPMMEPGQKKPREVFLIATDVSKRVESELERKHLFAALAHDIRNPLLGIKNTLDVVLGGNIGEIQPPRLKGILSAFQKSNYGLLLMLSNIVDVFKHESTTEVYRFKPESIVRIAREVAAEVENLSGNESVKISTDFEEGIPDINLDEAAIRRLFMNLLFNAVKFAEPGTEIKFDIFTRAAIVVILVNNKGPQMGSDKLGSVFRGVMETGSIKYGSGLGLYLCRKIAEAHGFTIGCLNKKEKGTSFVLEHELVSDTFKEIHSSFYRIKDLH